jgi:hypothetical protein
MSRIPCICRQPAGPAGVPLVLPSEAALADLGGAASMSAGVGPALRWLSFPSGPGTAAFPAVHAARHRPRTPWLRHRGAATRVSRRIRSLRTGAKSRPR